MTTNRKLPDFLIIGAMKAGTTTLHYYLSKHPRISAGRKKEPSFFTNKNWDFGLEWYQSLFPDTDSLKFEASTNYTKYPVSWDAPERIFKTIPDVKLIYIVRHPVERAISEMHHMRVSRGHYEGQVTAEMLEQKGRNMMSISRYYLQISQYLPFFDKSRLLFLQFEEMVSNPSMVLNDILRFLDLKDDFFNNTFSYQAKNTRSTRARVLFPKIHQYLVAANNRKLIPPVHRWLETPVPRPDVPLETKQYIWDAVAEDLQQFEQLIGRSLGYKRPE